jgi:putative ABC transport system permease protein
MHTLRMAIRALRSTPAVSAVVVLTLALGIGANTAIFSVVNSLLLRTLPVPEPGRLATISSDYALAHGFKSGVGWNYEMWTRLLQLPPVFDGVLLWSQPTFNLARGGEKEPARTLLVSGSFFSTLGIQPRLGRLLTVEDDVRGGGKDGPVAVISHRLWQERFAGSADTIGRNLTLDGAQFTVIGVTPPEFLGIEVGQAFDVAVPLGTEPLILGKRSAIDERRAFTFVVLVRLKPGQSLEAATAVLRSIQPAVLGVAPERLADVMPPFLREPFVAVAAPTGTSDFSRLRVQYERPLVTLQVLVGLVLLIACVNVACVLLARAAGRRHEMAVRIALGAGRRQLVPQLLIESVLLAAAGATVGLLLASWGSHALVSQLSDFDTEVTFNLRPDWRVLGFTIAIALATAILFGTAPAFRATNVQPLSALRGPRGSRGTGGGARLTSGLTVLQIALSLMLVVAAGLFVRTFGRLLNVPLGFDSGRVLIATVDTARARIDPAERLSFYERLAEAVSRVPGVTHAAASMDTPLSRARQAPVLSKAERVESVVAPGWFATYGTRLVAGRDFSAQDSAGAPRIAIVNQAFARKFFPDRNALGEVTEGKTIVGIVGDAVFATVRGGARPTLYIPLAQSAGKGMPGRTEVHISVRSAAGPPARLGKQVSVALNAVDPALSYSFRTLQEYVDASVSQERVVARLAGLFGGLALLLAGLGLYGVTSYTVSRRQFEIGIRMALGAQRTHVMRLVLFRSFAITATGLILGLAGAIATTSYLEALLFGVVPLDRPTFIAVLCLLAMVAVTAAGIPAQKATRIDPLLALRAE